MYRCTTIPWFVQNPTLYNTAKNSYKTDTCSTAKMLESFVMHTKIKNIFAGINSTGLSHGQSSYYYTKRAKLRRKFVKISICADMRRQIICDIKNSTDTDMTVLILHHYCNSYEKAD
jgi:hypothetical protein